MTRRRNWRSIIVSESWSNDDVNDNSHEREDDDEDDDDDDNDDDDDDDDYDDDIDGENYENDGYAAAANKKKVSD